jgi:hypothetical protein
MTVASLWLAFAAGASGCAALVGAEFDVIPDVPDADAGPSNSSDAAGRAEADGHADGDLSLNEGSASEADVSVEARPGFDADVSVEGPDGDAMNAPDRDERDVRAPPDVNAPCAPYFICGGYPWPYFDFSEPGVHFAVPYDFDTALTPAQRETISSGMRAWTDATKRAILFRQATMNDPKFVRFLNVGTCGGARLSEPNVVPFEAADCSDEGNLLHEMGILLGLSPTNQRSDRDRYLQLDDAIALECVSPDARAQQIAPKCDPLHLPGGDFGVFDFQSIMMPSGFSEAGKTSRCGTPPTGDRAFVRRGIAEDGSMPCKSDVEANWRRTKITPWDGAAVMQIQFAAWTGWLPFTSLSRDVDPHAPLDVQLAPGVTIASSPAIASLGGETWRVFVRGSDGNIWDGGGGQRPWENLGTPPGTSSNDALTEPAAASWSQDPSHIDVVAVANSKVYRRVYDVGWEDWDTSIAAPPGGAASAAAIASGGFGSLIVCVVGGDGQVWASEWNGSKWGWAALPSLPNGLHAASSPAVTARSIDDRHVLARGSDGALYYISGRPAWAGWIQIAPAGASGVGRPTIAPLGSDTLAAYVRGTDSFLWQIACQSPSCDGPTDWPPPIPFGAILVGDPAVSGVRGAMRVDIVFTSADGAAFPTPSSAPGLWHGSWERKLSSEVRLR